MSIVQPTHAVETAEHVLFIIGLILACGSISGFIARKIRVPDIVLFLLVGIILGPEIDVIVVPTGSALNQIILIFGAAYIIFDGGATVALRVLKNVWISLVVIATVGVVVSMFIVGYAAHWIFGIPLMVALLLGAVIASTDPATLVPVFKQVRVRERVSHLVMSESALNDAMGAIVTVTLMSVVIGGAGFSVNDSLLRLAQEAGLGILVGGAIGGVALLLIAHEKYAFLREYMPLVTLIVVLGGYLGADMVSASGYMAAFIAGVLIGNKDLLGLQMEPGEEKDLESFIGTTSLIMRMFIFILLGTHVDFHLLSKYWAGGILLIAIFMLIARPVTVFLCCLPDRRAKWDLKELLFMCWVRETGVIPAALAGLLVGAGAPHADLIASVTFMAVLVTILVQATTTKFWGGKLGLLVEGPPQTPQEMGHPLEP
ncbi:MAG TPA: sodium:proton antiporter [Gammaproteobacteria bacterium]|nr:sodium:proton antiporter [Gammaproteobacteria bacterium]